MQFDDSDAQDGFVQILRNIQVKEDTFTAKMHVEPGRIYTFTERSTGETFKKTSEELEEGLTATVPHRTAKLYFYTWENK